MNKKTVKTSKDVLKYLDVKSVTQARNKLNTKTNNRYVYPVEDRKTFFYKLLQSNKDKPRLSKKLKEDYNKNLKSSKTKTRIIKSQKQRYDVKTKKQIPKAKEKKPDIGRKGYISVLEKSRSLAFFKGMQNKGKFKNFYSTTIGKDSNLENPKDYYLQVKLNSTIIKPKFKHNTNTVTVGISENQRKQMTELYKKDTVEAMEYVKKIVLSKFKSDNKYQFIEQSGKTVDVEELVGIFKGGN